MGVSREVIVSADNRLVLVLVLVLGFEGGVCLEGKPEYVRLMVWLAEGLRTRGASRE